MALKSLVADLCEGGMGLRAFSALSVKPDSSPRCAPRAATDATPATNCASPPARELVDQGTPIEAACRIVILEDQLEEAQRINAEYRRAAESSGPPTA
ncbi:hypothetical protein GCM10009646_69080 [Streptomyces aureus]